MKYIYFALAIIGAAVPLTKLISFINEYGLDFSLLLQQAFENHISAFGWLDVIITVVVITFMTADFGKRYKIKHLWIPILASFTVGASFGLPVLMLMYTLKKESLK
ncbi:DUF2834 domain-containing protein [Chryseobacterium sp.]|uniref:DUF2834 domain-containing protein n=1 Tax=Chryseobacterium sp. TaxID=1871047 RepID=UPI00289C5BFA|nr:DUF2834 domain-containing protein [Chryseobacterium sp.]